MIPCMQPRRLKSCKVQTWPLCGLTPGNARNTEWKLGRDVLSGICIWRSIRAWNLMFLPNVQLWGSVSVEPLKAWPRGGHDSACFCVQCWSQYGCNLTSPWSDHVGVIFTSTMSAGKRSSTDLVVTSPCLQDCMRVGGTLWTKPFPLVRNRTRAEGLTGHSVRLLHLRCTFSHLFRILKLCFAMKVLRCCALSTSKVAHGPKKVLSENCECDCSIH